MADGADAATAARWLNAALQGYAAFSDSPDFDAAWLAPLFAAAGIAPTFRLWPSTLSMVAFDCASDFTLIEEEARRRVPQTHRAGPDAARQLEAWRIARERWRDAEHARFVEAIKLYGRAWGKVQGAKKKNYCFAESRGGLPVVARREATGKKKDAADANAHQTQQASLPQNQHTTTQSTSAPRRPCRSARTRKSSSPR